MCTLEWVQPIAFGVSFNLILESQSNWSLFYGTWQKRLRELENRIHTEYMSTYMYVYMYLECLH